MKGDKKIFLKTLDKLKQTLTFASLKKMGGYLVL
jgi:hypothetical protein